MRLLDWLMLLPEILSVPIRLPWKIRFSEFDWSKTCPRWYVSQKFWQIILKNGLHSETLVIALENVKRQIPVARNHQIPVASTNILPSPS